MRYIGQKHSHDCGVACVAMISRKSYKVAKEAIFGNEPADYTDKDELTKALKKLGREPTSKLIPFNGKDFRKLETVALIKANVQKNGNWHWVVWDGKRILDPRRKGYDGNRLKTVSYLVVK